MAVVASHGAHGVSVGSWAVRGQRGTTSAAAAPGYHAFTCSWLKFFFSQTSMIFLS
jgi:hypothetical protein